MFPACENEKMRTNIPLFLKVSSGKTEYRFGHPPHDQKAEAPLSTTAQCSLFALASPIALTSFRTISDSDEEENDFGGRPLQEWSKKNRSYSWLPVVMDTIHDE